MTIFFTSDTHFFHAKIAYLCQRKVPGIEKYSDICRTRDPEIAAAEAPFIKQFTEEMNETLIENHNKVVRKGDTYYHMGDFAWHRTGSEKYLEIFKRLNGDKHLILGNHDEKSEMEKLPWSSIRSYGKVRADNRRIVMFHYPIAEHDGYWHDDLHVFGHVHSSKDKPFALRNKLSWDVGVDNNDLTPVALEDLIKKIEENK